MKEKSLLFGKTGVRLIWKTSDCKNDAISKILMKKIGHVEFEIARLDKNNISNGGISLACMFSVALVEDCEHLWIIST